MFLFDGIRRLALLPLLLLFIAGCAGVETYEPVNHREEGPENGLFSGPGGEFVIYRKEAIEEEETTDKEDKTSSGQPEKNTSPGVDKD